MLPDIRLIGRARPGCVQNDSVDSARRTEPSTVWRVLSRLFGERRMRQGVDPDTTRQYDGRRAIRWHRHDTGAWTVTSEHTRLESFTASHNLGGMAWPDKASQNERYHAAGVDASQILPTQRVMRTFQPKETRQRMATWRPWTPAAT